MLGAGSVGFGTDSESEGMMLSMTQTWKLLTLPLCAIMIPACSAKTVAETQDGAKTQAEVGTLPACSWPASLDRPDAYTTACVASRVELKCPPGTAPDATASCTNECMSTEYAVSCGGPGVTVPLPARCRSLLAGPGGSVQGCCACGS